MRKVFLEDLGVSWATEEELKEKLVETAKELNLPTEYTMFEKEEQENGCNLITLVTIEELEELRDYTGVFIDHTKHSTIPIEELHKIAQLLYIKNVEENKELNLPFLEMDEAQGLYSSYPYNIAIFKTNKSKEEILNFIKYNFVQDKELPGVWVYEDFSTVFQITHRDFITLND